MRLSTRTKHSKITMPPSTKDDPLFATAERARQLGGVRKEAIGEGNKIGAKQFHHVAKNECKLDAYLHAGKIERSHHAAGIKFRAAWLTKARGISTRDSLTPSTGSGDIEEAINRLPYAEKVLKQAFGALSLKQAQVIVDVCGEDSFAGEGERLVTLARGLEALADLWSLK